MVLTFYLTDLNGFNYNKKTINKFNISILKYESTWIFKIIVYNKEIKKIDSTHSQQIMTKKVK